MARRKSHTSQVIRDVFVLYLIAIGFGMTMTVGIDAMIHFVSWAPYSDFPWLLLRAGIAAGVAAMSVILTFCWAGAL